MQTNLDDKTLLAAARAEQTRIHKALAQLQPDGAVRIGREHFVRLAGLIDRLVTDYGCEDLGCFNEPLNGIRWWVPLPEAQRTLAELETLRFGDDGIRISSLMADDLSSPSSPVDC